LAGGSVELAKLAELPTKKTTDLESGVKKGHPG
jgi:hypothetical protein